MKSIQNEPADEKNDQPDTVTKYKNFANRKLSQTTDSSDDTTVGNFVNPIYRDKSLRSNTGSTLNKQNSESYDNLNFNRSDSQNNLNNGKQLPAKRTDITKPPPREEYEMGVQNRGYGDNEKTLPNSWDKNLTAFSPYAVDTPIGDPVNNSRDNSFSLSTHKRDDSISKKSDYSFIGEENPYAAPILSPAYDTIPGQQKGKLPPPRQGTKKSNLTYESAVIQHTQVKKKTSSPHPKEGSEAEEGSGCCQLIFTVLVGLIALVALVVVFLMVFGIVSAKKCKECDVEVSTTDKQTGGGTTNPAILAELQYLRNNLTALKNDVVNAPKPVNQTDKIIALQNEIAQQSQHIQQLTNQLTQQQIMTNKLNQTTRDLKLKLTSAEQKMTTLDMSHQIRHAALLNTVRNLEQTTYKNVSWTHTLFSKVNATLTRDILQTRLSMTEKLTGKISTRNFSKLINDSQYVVDQLYGMINTSKLDIDALNQTFVRTSKTLQLNVTALENQLNVADVRRCNHKTSKTVSESATPNNRDILSVYVTALNPANSKIIAATCDSTANSVELSENKDKTLYTCDCKGVLSNENTITCIIHFWYCFL